MLPKNWKLVVIKQTGRQFHAVKEQIFRKDVSDIIIATDAGREGELVARWILEKAGNKKPLKRLWISSVTDKAIRDGFAHLKPGKDYYNLYRAAVARAESRTWVVGIKRDPRPHLQILTRSFSCRACPDADPCHNRRERAGNPPVSAAGRFIRYRRLQTGFLSPGRIRSPVPTVLLTRRAGNRSVLSPIRQMLLWKSWTYKRKQKLPPHRRCTI